MPTLYTRTGSSGMGSHFPRTRWSLVARVVQPGSRMGSETRNDAYAELVSSYWRPVYRTLRVRCRKSPEESEDLTQNFFLHLLEKKTLQHFVADPDEGRFRSLLRSLLTRFVATADRNARRLKRAGGHKHVSLDPAQLADIEGRIARADSPVDPFDEEWRATIIEQAMADMANEARDPIARRRLEVFLGYEIEPEGGQQPTYAKLARDLGIKPHDVKNDLVAMRRRFAELVLDRIREEVRSEAEAREELRILFGEAPPPP